MLSDSKLGWDVPGLGAAVRPCLPDHRGDPLISRPKAIGHKLSGRIKGVYHHIFINYSNSSSASSSRAKDPGLAYSSLTRLSKTFAFVTS